MSKKIPPYYTYILRFWKEQNAEEHGVTWRFTIEDTASSTRHGFDNLDEMIAFLQAQLDQKQR